MTPQLPSAMLPSLRLDGQQALVTGAGRGIGRAVALALAEAGADVALVSRSPDELASVAADVEARGRRALPLVCDVTDAAQVGAAFAGLERLDLLVNNAGSNIPEPFVEVTEAHLDFLLQLNIKATFLVAQQAARLMLARGHGGVIINMSSQMGHVGAPNRTVYCMTKHAVEGLSKALAVELAPHGIRVNTIGPTFIETPLTQGFLAQPSFRESVLARIPLGRLGQLEDVVGAVVFLASPAAALITGASLLIDGGWTAQ
jgi:NAD(P)-dependent dehydrogenase (short-subunit alcohol dehydrogenase family)